MFGMEVAFITNKIVKKVTIKDSSITIGALGDIVELGTRLIREESGCEEVRIEINFTHSSYR